MINYFEYGLAIGCMAVVLVWLLVTSSVITVMNLTLPITLLRFTVTLLMSNNSVLLMEKASSLFQFNVRVRVISTVYLIDYFVSQ